MVTEPLPTTALRGCEENQEIPDVTDETLNPNISITDLTFPEEFESLTEYDGNSLLNG